MPGWQLAARARPSASNAPATPGRQPTVRSRCSSCPTGTVRPNEPDTARLARRNCRHAEPIACRLFLCQTIHSSKRRALPHSSARPRFSHPSFAAVGRPPMFHPSESCHMPRQAGPCVRALLRNLLRRRPYCRYTKAGQTPRCLARMVSLAGILGFEPRLQAPKTRVLTTGRYPNASLRWAQPMNQLSLTGAASFGEVVSVLFADCNGG